MPRNSLVLLAFSLLATAAPQAAADVQDQRPVYAIAHRVLTKDGVTAALKDGANAIEIDVCAYKEGWWADHDCGNYPPFGVQNWLPFKSAKSYGDSMSDMFVKIAHERTANHRPVNFVWLDIKTSKFCSEDPCSLDALRKLARDKLEPAGVRVLFGFTGGQVGDEGWEQIAADVNDKEAVSICGTYKDVLTKFEVHGKEIPLTRRVMDKGLFSLRIPLVSNFDGISEELRKGAVNRDGPDPQLKRVLAWTTNTSNTHEVDKLLGTAGVDGIIYGFRATHYYEHKDTSKAAQIILDWVAEHGETHRMATVDDKPW